MEDTEIETKEAEARGKSENEKGQGVEDKECKVSDSLHQLVGLCKNFYLHKT